MEIKQLQFLEVKDLWKHVNESTVLRGINLIQHENENLGIAGETGSGKSSLLKIIAGLMQPDKGSVIFNCEKVRGPHEKLIAGHKSIAYLSQHFELRNNYRVEELMEMAMQVRVDTASKIFSLCQVDHLLKRKTDQLSGGEKQRIAIARLLITFPKLLILDEPYSNLDHAHKNIMKSVSENIDEELNISCILVSHDPADLLSWADSIVVMKDGAIIQHADPATIYEDPTDEYVATMFGKINKIIINGHQRMVRPERLQLSSNQHSLLTGVVLSTKYFGSHCEVDIAANDNILTVRTTERSFDNGDRVSIDLK